MNVLVTGGTGFVGSKTADRLKTTGHNVTISGRGPLETYKGPHQYLQLNLLEESACLKAVENTDCVVHCAGLAGTWGSYQSYFSANIQSTEVLLKACKNSHVARFINLSSPSVYFDYKNQENLKEEDIPKKFSNAYAETKYKAEQLVLAANSQSFSTLSFRPRGVIGAGDRNWLPRFIELRKRNRLVQPGDGKNLADFTSVENLLDAIELGLSTNVKNCGRTYNITNGEPLRLWDFIEKALLSVGLDGKRKKVPKAFAMSIASLSEHWFKFIGQKIEPSLIPIKVGVASYTMTLDISAAQKLLGYQPKISTHEALNDFTRWYLKGDFEEPQRP